MKKMKLGEIKSISYGASAEIYTGELTIKRETEKAILLGFNGMVEYRNYDVDENENVTLGELEDEYEYDTNVWVPKKACKVEENCIEVEEWLWKKNGLANFTDGEN